MALPRMSSRGKGKEMVTRMGLEPMTTGLKENSGGVGSEMVPATCGDFFLASPNPSFETIKELDLVHSLVDQVAALTDDQLKRFVDELNLKRASRGLALPETDTL